MRPAPFFELALLAVFFVLYLSAATAMSSVRSDYYNDGSHAATTYVTDGVEINDTALHNVNASPGLNFPSGSVWGSAAGSCLDTDSCEYSNGQASIGAVSAKITGRWVRTAASNSSFQGVCTVRIYEDGNTAGGRRGMLGTNTNAQQWMVGIDTTTNGLNYAYYDGTWTSTSVPRAPTGQWFEPIFNWSSGTNMAFFIRYQNGTMLWVDNQTGAVDFSYLEFNSEIGSVFFYFDAFRCWAGDGEPLVSAGSTFIISAVNCTSCNAPVGDVTSPFTTADTTPTFRFSTDRNTYCRIHNQEQNFTTMGSGRDCGVTGLTSHTCTLMPEDGLSITNSSYVYIGCSAAESSNSSAKFQMQLTDFEPYTGVAIEKGINASRASSAAIYADQQVYVRTILNQQVTATFDRVAVFGAQRWAFSYRLENESSIGAFYNISPAFFFLELTNLSSQQLSHQVGSLINVTKT